MYFWDFHKGYHSEFCQHKNLHKAHSVLWLKTVEITWCEDCIYEKRKVVPLTLTQAMIKGGMP